LRANGSANARPNDRLGEAIQRVNVASGLLCCELLPDKALTQPSLGRETVRFSSILHDDLKSRAAAAG
jgi:hypothetical protein